MTSEVRDVVSQPPKKKTKRGIIIVLITGTEGGKTSPHQLNSEHTQPHASDARTPSMSLDLQRDFEAPFFASHSQPRFFFVLPFFAKRQSSSSTQKPSGVGAGVGAGA